MECPILAFPKQAESSLSLEQPGVGAATAPPTPLSDLAHRIQSLAQQVCTDTRDVQGYRERSCHYASQAQLELSLHFLRLLFPNLTRNEKKEFTAIKKLLSGSPITDWCCRDALEYCLQANFDQAFLVAHWIRDPLKRHETQKELQRMHLEYYDKPNIVIYSRIHLKPTDIVGDFGQEPIAGLL